MAEPIRLVLTTCPTAELAQAIARTLVEERLAACVNVLAPCRSVYRWQGEVCDDAEVPLLIKTAAACYPALEARLRALHPYELPEVVAVDLDDGSAAYLDWVVAQTGG